MYAPLWWYAWLGAVLLFGAISLLKRCGSRLSLRPDRRAPGHLAASDANWDGELALSDEDEHADWDPQAMAVALDEGDYAGRYAMTSSFALLTKR